MFGVFIAWRDESIVWHTASVIFDRPGRETLYWRCSPSIRYNCGQTCKHRCYGW